MTGSTDLGLPLASADSTNVARNHDRESVRYRLTNHMAALVISGRIEATSGASTWRGLPQQVGLQDFL